MRLLTVFSLVLALSACTTVPEQIQGTYPEISPARVDPGVFDSSVRWGGVIVSSKVKDSQTCFEILSRDLDKYLRPKLEDSTAGRFIACKTGFHDPMVFAAGREITVTGKIQSVEVRKLEEFDYRYPVLEVDDLVLWQKRKVVMRYRGFTDPFYGPWYGRGGYWGHWGGWGGYPYYRGHYPGYGHGYLEPRVELPDPAIIEP
ncbi:MAG: Slp/YeaY family lipoprotein [Xanthomonadales bacterium]|nr:Slp family lipoprotein [Gammaproteobacteria bacterium]MBT8052701.1 Slp family lipoprotein [Gammaproteobacteria bacterium]NND57363.1 Slp/YeaY family lipoprotein [Xanthomonadales bacterium]NNK50641.1 Slp/YeaY family lipoprotein [Xanthomonadales bacterium]